MKETKKEKTVSPEEALISYIDKHWRIINETKNISYRTKKISEVKRENT